MAMGQRLEERGETLEKARNAEVEELKAELSQREVQQAAAHKEELTSLKASYNDSIDRLKVCDLRISAHICAHLRTSAHICPDLPPSLASSHLLSRVCMQAEMLALIEERAASAETSKREYESQLLAVKRLHHDAMESLRQVRSLTYYTYLHNLRTHISTHISPHTSPHISPYLLPPLCSPPPPPPHRQSLIESEREVSRKHEATLLAKVSEYESAVAELRESTLAAFAEEQRLTDGALPKLQERLEAAAREHEKAAAELLRLTEEKLSMQVHISPDLPIPPHISAYLLFPCPTRISPISPDPTSAAVFAPLRSTPSGGAALWRVRRDESPVRAHALPSSPPVACPPHLTALGLPSPPHLPWHALPISPPLVPRGRYEHALADSRQTAEAALQQLDAHAQEREAELVRRLEAQAHATAAELHAAGSRAEDAMGLAMTRAREEREAAVEQCNAHWMSMVGRQSTESKGAMEAAEAAHAERLAVEVGKVAALEEAGVRQVEEASTKLREVEEALRLSSLDELRYVISQISTLLNPSHTFSHLLTALVA